MSELGSARTKRWSAKKKMEVVLRLLKGESVDHVSRDVGVETYRLDEWYREALEKLEDSFKTQTNNPLERDLLRAKQRVGELTMEVELLREKDRKRGPLVLKRWKS